MNYLKREAELRNAISKACKDKPKEQWEKESGVVLDAIRKIMDLITEKRMNAIEKMVYMDAFGEKERTMASEDPDPTWELIKEQMNIINRMCSKYGTESMFPEAMGETDPGKLENAYRTYERQGREVDLATRPYMQEAMKTGDFTEYDRKYDEAIEEAESLAGDGSR